MHCRSFFDRCCAHRGCAHFRAFICYGARTSGRRPLPEEGEAPRVRWGLCRWAIRGARKPPLRLGSPAKDAPGPRRATTRVRFQGIRSNLCYIVLKMRDAASTNATGRADRTTALLFR